MKTRYSIDELQDIWLLASKLHDGQKYGGHAQDEQIEYVNHIGSVAFEILTAIQETPNMDANLALKCAILHDTLEDTGQTYTEISARFGEKVAQGISALTKNETLEGKKNQMLDSLKRIKQQPQEIWAVKMADRICNLYAPPFYWTNDKIVNYRQEAILIYEELKDGNSYLATRLKQKIADYQKFMT